MGQYHRSNGRQGGRHHREPGHAERGFSLLETLIALAILASGLVGVASLSAVAARASQDARRVTVAVTLASQKMEQLRALALGYDVLGLPSTDTTSDPSSVPTRPAGGSGLLPSPGGTLASNTPGYVDYLDVEGRWVGTGSTMARGTAYVRRWSIGPLPSNPGDAVVFRVVVIAIRPGGAGAQALAAALMASDARLVGIKARKAG